MTTYHNPQRHIYVEISPRRSGKTIRLLQSMKDWLLEDLENIAYIESYNHIETHRIIGLLCGEIGESYLNRIISTHISGYRRGIIKYFFDEFNDIRHLEIHSNSYYTGTIMGALSRESNYLLNNVDILRENDISYQYNPHISIDYGVIEDYRFIEDDDSNDDDLFNDRCGIS